MRRTILMIQIFILSVFTFGIIYYIVSLIDKTAFTINHLANREMTLFEAIYFSFITQSTIGYGDFSPNTSIAKTVVILHILVTYILFGLTVLI
uniref:Potassium channel domain-containing protein n=1 Tax=viral metagenome TaxID=1070528 RepID=A0A6C0JCP5_9ZZZZ